MSQLCFPGRRANQRLSFFADVDVMLPDGRLVSAQLSELSAAGCFIEMLEPIPAGSDLYLLISDGVKACDLHGEVVYTQSGGGMGIFGMGVRFVKLDGEQQSTIAAWLKRAKPNTAAAV